MINNKQTLNVGRVGLNPQLEQTLRSDVADGDSPESVSVAQQNVELRRRLDEEQAAYRRKLTAYQEGQQRQAQLVQRLQAKVPSFIYSLCRVIVLLLPLLVPQI